MSMLNDNPEELLPLVEDKSEFGEMYTLFEKASGWVPTSIGDGDRWVTGNEYFRTLCNLPTRFFTTGLQILTINFLSDPPIVTFSLLAGEQNETVVLVSVNVDNKSFEAVHGFGSGNCNIELVDITTLSDLTITFKVGEKTYTKKVSEMTPFSPV